MPGLNPSIVENNIDTWLDITPVQKKQQPLHPSKAAAIKAEIDKLRAVGFIYPIAYTSWVSNPVPVNKKQGTIHVCTEFRDLNHACPKDNFPMPSSIKLSTTTQAMRLYPSWTISLVIIKSKSIQPINTKPHSPPLGVHLRIGSCLLA
jgi:hypothetical protein